MIKAVIFDMDGVLVDTERYHEMAYKTVAKKFGVNLTEKEIIQFKGVTALENIKYLFKKYKINENAKKYTLLKDKIYRSFLKNLKALPGVIELLKKFKKKKIKLALASSGSRLNVGFILKKIKAKKIFDVVIHGEQVKKGKPNPEIFLKAAKKLKVMPKDCVVIEDAINGVKAAKNAGMFCIGVATTFSKQKLKNADLIVDSLKELEIENTRGWGT